MGYADDRGRPPVLNLITLFSFGLSILNVLWLGFLLLIAVVIGIAGTMVPGFGLPVAAVAGIFALFLLAQSFLSLILFGAAWKTWTGAEGGRSLHRGWAWITLVVDVIDLGVHRRDRRRCLGPADLCGGRPPGDEPAGRPGLLRGPARHPGQGSPGETTSDERDGRPIGKPAARTPAVTCRRGRAS